MRFEQRGLSLVAGSNTLTVSNDSTYNLLKKTYNSATIALHKLSITATLHMVFRAHRTEMRLRKSNAHYDMQFRRRGEDEEAVLAIGRVPQLLNPA